MQYKIGIIEDNELNLKLFQNILEANNYKVYATRHAHEALSLIETNLPHLILMDIQLRSYET